MKSLYEIWWLDNQHQVPMSQILSVFSSLYRNDIISTSKDKLKERMAYLTQAYGSDDVKFEIRLKGTE